MNITASAVTDAAASVEEFFRHVDEHDFDWVEAALTADCVIDAPGFRQEGAEVVALWMAGFFAAFPDLRHRPHRVVAGDNEVACLVEVTGTHTEDLAFPDVEIEMINHDTLAEADDEVADADREW